MNRFLYILITIIVIVMTAIFLSKFWANNKKSSKQKAENVSVRVESDAFVFQDFLQMKGNLIRHPFNDKQDDLSTQEILELNNEDGVPIWFGRKVRKVVCLTSECKLANLWLFWNGVGEYMGFQIEDNEPLTKYNHEEFSARDYLKLHQILSDSNSILKGVAQELLTGRPNSTEMIDGASGATHKSFKGYLVEDAAFTCYTLWQTVYGNTLEEIRSLLEQRVDAGYLRLLFSQENYKYKIWAINQIKNKDNLQDVFKSEISFLITSDNYILSNHALDYFTCNTKISDSGNQLFLLDVFYRLSYSQKERITLALSRQAKVNDQVVIRLFQLFEEKQLDSHLLKYVYSSISADNLKNLDIYNKIQLLANDKNFYVKEISKKMLEKYCQ